MTPCEVRGYKLGALFRVLKGPAFTAGSIVRLDQDDGSGTPRFLLVKGECRYDYSKSWHTGLRNVKPLTREEQLTLLIGGELE